MSLRYAAAMAVVAPAILMAGTAFSQEDAIEGRGWVSPVSTHGTDLRL